MIVPKLFRDRVVISGVVAAAFLAIFFLVWMQEYKNSPLPSTDQSSIQMQAAHWEERIKAVGGKAAYEEFAQSVANEVPEQQHEGAHIFGGVLYGVEGISGLPTCDSRFSSGCFHQFLGRAITDHGLSVVQELYKACATVAQGGGLSCLHGLGHGIQATLGYSFGDLQTALATCKSLPYNDPIGGCYGGVFMEYNMRSMLGGSSLREEKDNNMYAPCDTIVDSYVLPCTFWQPQWWNEELLSHGIASNIQRFTMMGLYCEHLGKTPTLLRACFEGIGNIAANGVQFDPDKSVALCNATSDLTERRAWCINLVASSIGDLVSVSEGDRACAYLSSLNRAACIESVRAGSPSPIPPTL